MAEIFDRPKLSAKDLADITHLATVLVNALGRQGSVATVVLLLGEIMRLIKEVNLHREKLGYELLPTFDPNFK